MALGYIPGTYSTSLMALEERVKAIDCASPLLRYNSTRPLEGMADILRRTGAPISPPGGIPNGIRSNSTSPAVAAVSGPGSEGRTSPSLSGKYGSVTPTHSTASGLHHSNCD